MQLLPRLRSPAVLASDVAWADRMKTRHGWALALAVVFALGACASGSDAIDAPDPTKASNDTEGPSTAQDVWALEPFSDLEPGTYFIDPDIDSATSLRVVYEIPAEGWQSWIGAGKFSDVGHVGSASPPCRTS